MHFKGKKTSKLSRDIGPRKAIKRSLASSLVEHGYVVTTTAKAKILVRYMERIISRGKKGDISSIRYVYSKINTKFLAHKLLKEIMPKMKRSSGHLRQIRAKNRYGDNALMMRVEFCDQEDIYESGSKTDTAPVAAATAQKTKNSVKNKEPGESK